VPGDLTPIRTTMQPDRVLYVEPNELLDLQRQGLVLPEPTRETSAPADQAKTASAAEPQETTTTARKPTTDRTTKEG
jgi:hypothetical protein